MEKFAPLTGLVAPLRCANVDTDAIIPKQFLKSIKRTGFGRDLFDERRYDAGRRAKNPDFVLNQPRYRRAQILRRAARISAAAPRASMRRGRCATSASARDRAVASPTSSSTTASRTACCRWRCPRRCAWS